MTYHLHKSGYVALLDSWGHGRYARGNWSVRPATIIVDDGDGHYSAWQHSGQRSDALSCLATLVIVQRGDRIGFVEDGNIQFRSEPDFWCEQNDDFVPDLNRFPNAIAY